MKLSVGIAVLAAMVPHRSDAGTPPPVITRPLQVWWGAYRGNHQLVEQNGADWEFVRSTMDGYLLHGAYWNQPENPFGEPSPDVIGPKLATLLAKDGKPVIVEHLLAGEYPNVDTPFGLTFAGTTADAPGFGSAISNIRRLQAYGFPQPDVASDFIVEVWKQAVRYHPEWTSEEFFTALTGNWDGYTGKLFDNAAGSPDRLRYGWFRQWVERLAEAFPTIRVTSTNSPVYFHWNEAGEVFRELGGEFNNHASWLKLERRGSTLDAFCSGDGFGWLHIVSAQLPSGADLTAGVHLQSPEKARSLVGEFSNTRLLPFFWGDIGRCGRPGTVEVAQDRYILVARGNEQLHPEASGEDAQFYVWREWVGDGEFTVRLTSLVGSNPSRTDPRGETPTAGLTLRESAQANSRQVSLVATLANELELLVRSETAAPLALTAKESASFRSHNLTKDGVWLHLKRTGSQITATFSMDGVAFSPIAGQVPLNLPKVILVGMSADSQVRFETATATFETPSFLPRRDTESTSSGASGNSAAKPQGELAPHARLNTDAAPNSRSVPLPDKSVQRATTWRGDGTLVTRLNHLADSQNPNRSVSGEAEMGLFAQSGTSALTLVFTPDEGIQLQTHTHGSSAPVILATHGKGEVSLEPLGAQRRPLHRYFSGNDFLEGLHGAFPKDSPYHQNFSGFTTDSPYGDYQRWGGSETHPDAIRHREKIRHYERWLQANGRLHDFIANTTAQELRALDTTSQEGQAAWDLIYKRQSMRSLQLHQLEGGRADRVYLESWYKGPFQLVPESKDGTFTNLVREAILYVKGEGQTLDLRAERAPNKRAYQVFLKNTGTVPALPLIHAYEEAGGTARATYQMNGQDITRTITSPDGQLVTDAPLHSGAELIEPGAEVLLTVTLTEPGPETLPRILIRAFWNPQDPSAQPRASLLLAPRSQSTQPSDSTRSPTDR